MCRSNIWLHWSYWSSWKEDKNYIFLWQCRTREKVVTGTFQSLLYCILKTSKLFVSVLISLMEDTPAPDQISAKSMKISLLGNISCKCESGYFFTSSNLLHLLTQFIFKGMRVKCEEIGCDNVDVGKVLRIQKIWAIVLKICGTL